MKFRYETFLLIAFVFSMAGSATSQTEHFDPKGKPPSKHTIAVIEQARSAMPFGDKRDFDEQKKGFIAAPDSRQIMADAGHVAWDLGRFAFYDEGENFDKALLAQIEDGTAKVEGDASVLAKLGSTLVHFEMGFEILPGTKGGPIEATAKKPNPYEVGAVHLEGE